MLRPRGNQRGKREEEMTICEGRVGDCPICGDKDTNLWLVSGHGFVCYQCMCAGKSPAQNKYHNIRTETEIGMCASKAEASRAAVLERRFDAGEISNLCHQVPFRLEVNGVYICKYVADSTYDEDGAHIVEDCKGHKTAEYKLKKRLMLACHGITIRETT